MLVLVFLRSASVSLPCLRRGAAHRLRRAGGPCGRFRPGVHASFDLLSREFFLERFCHLSLGQAEGNRHHSHFLFESEWQSEDVQFLSSSSRVPGERPLPFGARTDDGCVGMREEPGGLRLARPPGP